MKPSILGVVRSESSGAGSSTGQHGARDATTESGSSRFLLQGSRITSDGLEIRDKNTLLTSRFRPTLRVKLRAHSSAAGARAAPLMR
ncbi:hypothetical protein EYF80_018126 [Liparis tanakae]|uniref:Uncharacterized protein n=1 Tax=Liparis tanakae TaxID=230148 RepID=A0A4Z2I1A3_9TELE|nr:hypothetical protein EYF80_018126 [Liparis tanakae]